MRSSPVAFLLLSGLSAWVLADCSARPVDGGGQQNGGVPGGGAAGGGVSGGAGPGPNGGAAGRGRDPGSTGGVVDMTGGSRGTDSGASGEAGSTAGRPGPMPDAASTAADAGREAAAATKCAGLFCEDFETGVLDPAIWDVQVNGNQPAPAVVTQTSMVAHGRYAVRFHANPNVVSYDFIITKAAPVGLKGHHFGRAYFMVTPMPPANHTEYIYAGTTGFPRYRFLEVASAAPLAWQLTYVNLIPPNTGEDYHSGGKVPIGRWFCLEWEFNDAPDRAVVYVDGVQDFGQNTFTFGGATTGLVGDFAAFGFGYYAWHPATYAFDVFYDDIVLDANRVGCLD
jgi:hypothetical protein